METTTTLSERVRGRAITRSSLVSRVLGHPVAFAVSALILLWIFAGPFITDSARVAPTKDPAYYSWRIETLVSEKPADLLGIKGAFGMFSGGYRVANAVLGAYLREIPGISLLKTTVFVMVGIPWLTSLLLAGFAYRQRRDPLMWHAVAFGSAGLLLTPPYVGYMDNVLCLLFLSAAVWFIGPSSTSWPARTALFLFMLLAGVTHPTTLAFFVLTLFFIAAARLVFRKLALRSVLRDDGPMLLTAVLAAICTYAIWKVGIWGPSESLSEAALSPPYSSGFFIGRMMLWVAAMRPALNGVLFAIGAIALLAVGRGMVEDELPRISLGWLLPLVGLFGFVGGLTYPYYRFFNTTMAIPLLIGVGAYFALRLMFDWIERGGVGLAGIVGVLAVVFVLVTNFSTGLMKSGWTKPGNQWIDIDQRKQLSLLRGQLEAGVDPARPVVFVIDEETSTFQIWGFTKLSGNTSRFGLPRGQIDKGYLYLGSLDNYLAGRPTLREGQETYNKVSRATARGTQHVAEVSGRDPLVVVVQSFNATASNADVASGRTRPPAGGNVWVVNDHGLTKYSDGRRVGDVPLAAASTSSDDGGLLHILRIAGALLLLALPGWLAFRFFVPGGGFALGLGMVPALASAILTFVGTIALAVARSPFSGAVMWISVIVSILLAAALRVRARLAPQHVPDSLAL